jgi:hypothetical protein
MALANVAALLAKKGKSVLAIDWDLEAPGLEKYFSKPGFSLVPERKTTPGLIDLVSAFVVNKPLDWRKCLLYAQPFSEGNPVTIITAGKDSADFVPTVQSINWQQLFNDTDFGTYLEELREEWLSRFDFILVDSRTGITDIGGICTIHLPDILVLLFTANDQSLSGVTDVMNRARRRYDILPFDRAKLLGLPVPSRFENFTEYQLAADWKRIFAERLTGIYKDWLPDKTTPGDVLEKLFIPYVPFWSFGEGLPVVKEGSSDPRSLGFAYDLLARVLESRLQWNEALQGDISLGAGDRAPEAIDQDAERIFGLLPLVTADVARQVLLRLVRVVKPEEGEESARKVPEREFDLFEQDVIERLINSRVLHKSVDKLTKEPTIEIAQETLIRNWRRLRAWIDEDRDFLLWRQDLHSKMLEWEMDDHDKSLLLGGTFLARAERIMDAHSADLNELEKEFIRVSLTERDRRRYQEGSRRVLSYLPYAVAIVAVTIVVFYGYQQQSSQKAQAARLESITSSLESSKAQSDALSKRLEQEQQRNAELTKELIDLGKGRRRDTVP